MEKGEFCEKMVIRCKLIDERKGHEEMTPKEFIERLKVKGKNFRNVGPLHDSISYIKEHYSHGAPEFLGKRISGKQPVFWVGESGSVGLHYGLWCVGVFGKGINRSCIREECPFLDIKSK